jgi:tRNA pseudouridine55 synthase
VDRAARPVEVSSLVLESFVPGEVAEVSVVLTCSAGTYVRTIAHDLGTALGVGGSLVSLRRLANGAFSVEEAVTLEQIDRTDPDGIVMLGMDVLTAVRRTLEVVEVDEETARRIVHGGVAPARGNDRPVGLIRPAAQGHPEQLVAIVADEPSGAHARSELVWTRPEELR